jgi:hypothetical protein
VKRTIAPAPSRRFDRSAVMRAECAAPQTRRCRAVGHTLPPRVGEDETCGVTLGSTDSRARACDHAPVGERFRMQMFYPVEGDSAMVELLYDGVQWADMRLEDMRLEDIRLDAVGDARLEGARVVVSVFPMSWKTAQASGRGGSSTLRICVFSSMRRVLGSSTTNGAASRSAVKT